MKNQRLVIWVSMGLMALLLFGNGGFRQWIAGWKEKRRLTNSLVHLRQEHVVLSRELTLIQKDPAHTEYLIRKNLGYIKKGEVEYRLLKPTPVDKSR